MTTTKATKPGNPNITTVGKKTQFKRGKSGNPKGRPPGVKNLSTLIQNLLGDPVLADKIFKKKPAWFEVLPEKNGAEAMVGAVLARAMDGDARSFDVLRRAGYGDKLAFIGGDGDVELPVYVVSFTPRPKPKPRAKAKPKAAAKPKRKVATRARSSKPKTK